MGLKKKYILLILVLLLSSVLYACRINEKASGDFFLEDTGKTVSEVCTMDTSGEETAKQESAELSENNYDLPVSNADREEAENNCIKVMELLSPLYEHADKGKTSNVVLSDETVLEMQNKVGETGCPVRSMVLYSDMENYEEMDHFLQACMNGKSGSIIVYEIHYDGGIAEKKYIFDGTDMCVLTVSASWNREKKPVITSVSRIGIEKWEYTDKGWFCYELFVPESPEVSAIVDGSYLVRIRPMTDVCREISQKYVRKLGYQGNNLLCSNWDADHMEALDYNGMFEYLYEMKYEKKIKPENYPDGIPKEEFESLIMEYLPVTAEQIQEYAVYNDENRVYEWVQLGCSNYSPTYFGTSLPEVTNISENGDGTVTLTVDAICDMVVCNDAVITHELTIRFAKDGRFRYVSNKILNDGLLYIPEYQYRLEK